jgi:hypothetical protein
VEESLGPRSEIRNKITAIDVISNMMYRRAGINRSIASSRHVQLGIYQVLLLLILLLILLGLLLSLGFSGVELGENLYISLKPM